MSDTAKAIAEVFVSARREARVVATYPGERPADLGAAYAIQDCAIALDGRRVVGWKVGKINPPDDRKLGNNRLAGPIFEDVVVRTTPGASPPMPVFGGGFSAAEAEFLLHVSANWNGELPISDAATLAVVDEVRLGIEVASSPYPSINADGPTVITSDFGNNAGLVMGPLLEDWQHLDLCAITVRTEIDGEQVGEATGRTMLDGPLGAVRFLLGNLPSRGIDISRGFWVSSGAITGVHQVSVGQKVVASFGDHGEVRCTITAARAKQGQTIGRA